MLSILLLPNTVAFAKSSSSKGLIQLPSQSTDFPNNDQSVVQVTVATAKKDTIGDYHIKGEIKNLSNDTLQFVKVTAHFIDANNQTVEVTTCCFTYPTDIEPGHTSTIDSFAQKDELSGTPTSYRLSFDWQ